MTSRRNPFDDLEDVLDRVRSEFGDLEEFGALAPGAPSVDVEDAGDAFHVSIDLPGVAAGDVDLELRGDVLHVEAERETAETDVGADYVTRERTRGTMRREVALPEPVDEDAVSASLENGVLTVDLPKAGDSGGTDIEVE